MREDGIIKIEVHVSGICIKRDPKAGHLVLLGKRSPNRKLYPGLWESGGGQVYLGETFESAIKRQFKEEFGIEIEIRNIIGCYSIPLENGVIPGVVFYCQPSNGHLLHADEREFTEVKWVCIDDLAKINIIPGTKLDILKAIKMVSNN